MNDTVHPVDYEARASYRHVLPDRFVKIRYYGLLGSRKRKVKLAGCPTLLGVNEPAHDEIESATRKDIPVWQELMLRVSGIDISKCPVCGKGRICSKEILRPLRNIRSP
jgi:hypothetical protein